MLKIGMPLRMNADESVALAADFRTSEYFGIVDAITRKVELISEDMLETHYNGKGISDVLKDKGVEFVICEEMMAMTHKVFHNSQIEVYKAMSDSIDENIRMFKEFMLPPFFYNETRQTSSCSASSCSTCSSSSCA